MSVTDILVNIMDDHMTNKIEIFISYAWKDIDQSMMMI